MEAWLRAALRCPICRGELRDERGQDPGAGGLLALVCTGECGSSYPVVDGIPVLLADEAAPPTGPGRAS